MAEKISLASIKAALKADETEQAELASALQDATKLKASLEKADAAIKSNLKEFSDATE